MADWIWPRSNNWQTLPYRVMNYRLSAVNLITDSCKELVKTDFSFFPSAYFLSSGFTPPFLFPFTLNACIRLNKKLIRVSLWYFIEQPNMISGSHFSGKITLMISRPPGLATLRKLADKERRKICKDVNCMNSELINRIW